MCPRITVGTGACTGSCRSSSSPPVDAVEVAIRAVVDGDVCGDARVSRTVPERSAAVTKRAGHTVWTSIASVTGCAAALSRNATSSPPVDAVEVSV